MSGFSKNDEWRTSASASNGEWKQHGRNHSGHHYNDNHHSQPQYHQECHRDQHNGGGSYMHDSRRNDRNFQDGRVGGRNHSHRHDRHQRRSDYHPQNNGGGVDLRQYTTEGNNDGGWHEVSHNRRRDHRPRGQPHQDRYPSDQQRYPSHSHQQHPCMLMLVGIPGSGKSTFSLSLEQAAPHVFARINQDSLGSRKKCEQATRQALSEGKVPIIDRCNFDFQQRKHFVNIAREFNVPVKVISLELPKQECIRRCQARVNHETIAPGEERVVVEKLYSQFQTPHHDEGFASVQRLNHVDQVNRVLQEYVKQYDKASVEASVGVTTIDYS